MKTFKFSHYQQGDDGSVHFSAELSKAWATVRSPLLSLSRSLYERFFLCFEIHKQVFTIFTVMWLEIKVALR